MHTLAVYAPLRSDPCSKHALAHIDDSDEVLDVTTAKSNHQVNFIVIETTTGLRNDDGLGTDIDLNATVLLYYRSLKVGNVTLLSWIEPYTFEWNANVALCLSAGGL